MIGYPCTQAGKLGLRAVSRKKNFLESHKINPLLTKLVRSRWLNIGLLLFFASLWTSTSSRSINTQKKNLANIQPSWPDTWSIAHLYCQVIVSTASNHANYNSTIENRSPWACFWVGMHLSAKIKLAFNIWYSCYSNLFLVVMWRHNFPK